MSRKTPFRLTIERWIDDFPELEFNGVHICCRICDSVVSCKMKSHILQHVRTKKHKSRASGYASDRERQKRFNFDLVKLMVNCNIPWAKLDNHDFRQFLQNCIDGNCDSNSVRINCSIHPWNQLEYHKFGQFLMNCIKGNYNSVSVPAESTLRLNYRHKLNDENKDKRSQLHLKNTYSEESNDYVGNKEEIIENRETFDTLTSEQIMQTINYDNNEHSIEQQISLMEENVFIKSEDILENSNVETNTNLFDVNMKTEEMNNKDEGDIINGDHLNQRLENFSIPVVELGFTKANSNNLPRMDLITIMEYFHENNNSITNEIKRLKSQTTGSQTYGDDAIRYVQVKHSPLLCEVKASVRPEYDINAKNYDVSCRINTVEDIVIEAKCADCIVNKGGCIHCVAFLMWLHRRNEDPPYGEEVNFWKNNDSTYNSGKRKDAAEGSVLRKYIESEQRKIENKMYTCQDPKFASLSIHSIGMNLRKSSNTKGESFKKFCEKHVDPKLILKVEEVTRNQSDSSLWQEMRYGRVTSSNALHVIKCETIDELEELEENILGTIISESEKLEMKNKVLKMLSSETSMQFFKTGILLSSDHPFVEATPDAINDTYVVEIKFPNSEESLPFYYDSTGNIKLKYVYQMQLQMLLAKKEKGILVIAQKDFESSGKLIIKCCTYSTCVTNSILNGINEFWIKHIYNKVS